METLHADAARSQLASLAAAGLGVDAFARAAFNLLRRVVPYDVACLTTADPATGLLTSAVESDPVDSCDEQFARYEHEVADFNQFAELARRANPVGILEREPMVGRS